MTSTNDSLQVSRRIAGKREAVFEAWTRPEKMGWFCPEDMQLVSAESDVRVGGKFRAAMQGEDGKVHTAFGTYEEITPNRRLVFTHGWEGPKPVETRVVVEFEDRDGGTLVSVTQTGFVDPEEAKGHEKGWRSTLANLAKRFPKSASEQAAKR